MTPVILKLKRIDRGDDLYYLWPYDTSNVKGQLSMTLGFIYDEILLAIRDASRE